MDEREHVIVCGVDGSPASRRALEWAIDEAGRRDCRLRAVTVWSWDGLESGTATTSPQQAKRRAAEVQQQELSDVLGDRSEPVVERLLLEGRPSEQLCTAALDAELLVLGSHGHGVVHDALVGSTSQHVIRHTSCPVVILPDPRHVRRELKRAHSKHKASPPQGIGPMF